MMTKIKYLPFFIAIFFLFLMSTNVIAHNKVVVIPLNSCKIVSSKIITVPSDYSTIQGAIEAANEGDTIKILAGTYNEIISIKKDNITLDGKNKDTTILNGNKSSSTISINNSKNISINNLSIGNGKNGISINFSSVYLSNLKIKDNGNGLQVVSNSHINIDNTFVNNNIDNGLELKFNSTAYIDNSEFNNNSSAGVFFTMGSSVYIQYSKTSNNSVGLSSSINTSTRIIGCEIMSNIFGIVLRGNATGLLTGHNIISDNGDVAGGAGIDISANSHLSIASSNPGLEISANKGPGISVSMNSSLLLEGGSINNNQGDGINLSGNSVGQIFYNIFPISIVENNGYGINCAGAILEGDVDKITFSNNALGDTNCP